MESGRLQKMVEAATQVFSRVGYRRAQMADIARELGVSPGTLYLYAEGKEALFDLVVRVLLGGHPGPTEAQRPVATPPEGSTLALLRRELSRRGELPSLKSGLAGKPPGNPALAQQELRRVLEELYAVLSDHRVGLLVLMRCALDWPELARVFRGEVRTALIGQLSRYLGRLQKADLVTSAHEAELLAIQIFECIGWWAVDRGDDALYAHLDEAKCRAIALDAALAAVPFRAQAKRSRR